ncbi:MAG TPA: hypothetical protein VHZ24_20165 [Pirellulales bacterium]|jgi:uncharacterized protein involved in exopolysaccharide biosynthesis|nr:hypothetical protein [Pirellulales bacterium]
MNRTIPISVSSLIDGLQLLVKFPLRWAVPAVSVAVLVGAFVMARRDTWEATQTLVARNDTGGAQDGPGKFRHSDELKAVLETFLELSKSHGVLEKALLAVGPSADRKGSAAWPTEQEIADVAGDVKVTAPKGAEFGKTEVFYLKVRANDRQRALKLADALCHEIEVQYGLLRNHRAASMVDELVEAERLAQADLQQSTSRLKELEKAVGSDLAELRNLHQPSGAGESDLRRKAVEMESELREARSAAAGRAELLSALREAENDPKQVLALPNGMLETLPSLRKVKDGLIDAQVHTSTLLGTMSPAHPAVQAARIAEEEITGRLREELLAATRGVEIDERLTRRRVESLAKTIDDIHGRFQLLASLRADYTTLIAESDQRSRSLAEVQRKLIDARASQAGAEKASLVTRVDAPETGPKPVGPAKAMLLAAGVMGGLLVGAAVLLFTVMPVEPLPRKRALADRRSTTTADLDVENELELQEAA